MGKLDQRLWDVARLGNLELLSCADVRDVNAGVQGLLHLAQDRARHRVHSESQHGPVDMAPNHVGNVGEHGRRERIDPDARNVDAYDSSGQGALVVRGLPYGEHGDRDREPIRGRQIGAVANGRELEGELHAGVSASACRCAR